MLRFVFSSLLLLVFVQYSTAQLTRNALFLGNSYTGSNNLPQTVKDLAISAGDTLIFDSNTPGGTTLEDHTQLTTTTSKIAAGGWDYVVIQGQSREPILQTSVFNFGAGTLTSLVRQSNPCAVIQFFATWGRENGDATFCPVYPVMCTYEGMDSALYSKYENIASQLNEELSPVSKVWHYIRQNHPSISLYTSDGSHPSSAGTYAAACSFYTTIFKKDPNLITDNYGLSATVASQIRNAAKVVAFDQLADWDFKKMPLSDFGYQIQATANTVFFSTYDQGTADTHLWDFGDGNTSTTPSPTHTYAANGIYTVVHTTTNCDINGLHTSSADTVITFCNHTPNIFTKNPWLCQHDTLWADAADSYKWYSGNNLLPFTTSYLPEYQQYNTGFFTVETTVSGCSEMSQRFYPSPQSPGYYFDMTFWNDPCDGDTVSFFVLPFSGSFSGTEIINWYRNDTLQTGLIGQDTILITEGGSYQCMILDTSSICPRDTVWSSLVTYDCIGLSTTNFENITGDWNLYPNPANNVLVIESGNTEFHNGQAYIYNATGIIIKTCRISGRTEVDIAELSAGIYFVRLSDHSHILKLIKQ